MCVVCEIFVRVINRGKIIPVYYHSRTENLGASVVLLYGSLSSPYQEKPRATRVTTCTWLLGGVLRDCLHLARGNPQTPSSSTHLMSSSDHTRDTTRTGWANQTYTDYRPYRQDREERILGPGGRCLMYPAGYTWHLYVVFSGPLEKVGPGGKPTLSNGM